MFAKGSGSPAFQVGYTEISYGAPSPGNFTFTPPPGATFDDTTKPQAGHKAAQEPDVNGTTGTYGAGWLTVAEVPATSAGTSPAGPSAGSPSTGAFGADSQAAISAFLGAGKTVSGSWGTGQLIHTALVNVLIVGDEMYVGAVDPSVLYAAVGHATPAGTDGD